MNVLSRWRTRALTAGLASLALLTGGMDSLRLRAEDAAPERPSLVLKGSAATVVLDLSGGSIGRFQRNDHDLNPLSWNPPGPGDRGIRGFGHFLCLDRWGPPSEAEGARGMPYHGEASQVPWTAGSPVVDLAGAIEGVMSARLPKAGLSIRRTVRLSRDQAVFRVREEITNENALGRLLNAVQHPTVGGAFLDETTRVDCNGRRGFAQGSPMPDPEKPSSYWPRAFNRDGQAVDLRQLVGDPEPAVASFAIDDEYGWVTAGTPKHRLLLGYLWRTRDYPWVSLWRDARNGKPAARGLEFGTTGLHQPFPVLVQKGRIWDQPLYLYLDAGERTTRSYTAFLLEIPPDFAGVESITIDKGTLVLRERRTSQPRTWTLPAEGFLP